MLGVETGPWGQRRNRNIKIRGEQRRKWRLYMDGCVCAYLSFHSVKTHDKSIAHQGRCNRVSLSRRLCTSSTLRGKLERHKLIISSRPCLRRFVFIHTFLYWEVLYLTENRPFLKSCSNSILAEPCIKMLGRLKYIRFVLEISERWLIN